MQCRHWRRRCSGLVRTGYHRRQVRDPHDREQVWRQVPIEVVDRLLHELPRLRAGGRRQQRQREDREHVAEVAVHVLHRLMRADIQPAPGPRIGRPRRHVLNEVLP